MTVTALGTKRACLHCAARFYDLNVLPPVCPKCSHVLTLAAPGERVRKRRTLKEKVRTSGDLLTAHMAATDATRREEEQEYNELDKSSEKEVEELEAGDPAAA